MPAIASATTRALGHARGSLVVVAALLVASLSTLFAQVAPASAVVAGTTNYPVTLTGAQPGYALPMTTAYTWGSSFVLSTRGLDVRPSPLSSELQHVRVHYKLQSRSLSQTVWRTVASRSASADLAQWVPNPSASAEEDSLMAVAVDKVQFPTVQWDGVRLTATSYYRVVVTVDWTELNGYLNVGAITLSPKVATDLRCSALATQCQVVTDAGVPVFKLTP